MLDLNQRPPACEAVRDISSRSRRLQLLKEIVPRAGAPVGILWEPANPTHPPSFREVERAAAALRVQIRSLEVRTASDLDLALSTATRDRAAALMVFSGEVMFANRRRIADFAARTRLPAIYSLREYIDVGGLMCYGPNVAEQFRQS